ncbi:FGGY-family carbohydrate kinase [Brucella rhizosphaerae]|uniref:FGGY-pentulose kinase family protein n=1 Tax=Brucella rhizosphaerae TaxID=571254 RepID=A0A256FKN5_9HYPH|nr:FGGY-family carbohydrate kinase [Brucella rhizosphaerae]OYR15389.1 FGGY-pentulose kinase family protein [Brucella rhizosphaerae]
MDVFLGVDVGTGSARAGLFTRDGELLASAKQNIRMWKQGSDIVEQSSEDIWQAVCNSVAEALKQAKVAPESVKGIGFDGTCSLVILDKSGNPLSASPAGEAERNIIVWMDHRAREQAERINATAHPVLRYVGGRISPEMETPKLLWLKENNPETFNAASLFFDLPDYLTYRATGSHSRSLCTVVCKWTYLGHEKRWDEDYFRAIGLGMLADEGFARIGTDIVDIATPLGQGLTEQAAKELGLLAGTAVGASLIDAHAGGVGTIAGSADGDSAVDMRSRLALIIGTSACTMSVTEKPAFVDGVWGPYWGAMMPGLWLNEGGQSAFGAATDYLVGMHPYKAEAEKEATAKGLSLLDYLEQLAIDAAGELSKVALLAKGLHVVPEFLGNRAPDADPEATGTITGIKLDASRENLVHLFVAGLCGLAYGTADILDALTAKDIPIRTIIVSGGAARSPLMRRILADATGLEVALPTSAEPVLLGSGIAGASAFEKSDLSQVAASMSAIAETIQPQKGLISEFHAAKRDIYKDLKRSELAARRLMQKF